jgi:hypothetical protein
VLSWPADCKATNAEALRTCVTSHSLDSASLRLYSAGHLDCTGSQRQERHEHFLNRGAGKFRVFKEFLVLQPHILSAVLKYYFMLL